MKLLAVVIIVFILVFLNGCIINKNVSFSGSYSDSEKYSVGPFEKEGLENVNLSVNWISGNVIIRKGNNNKFEVYEETTETEDKYKMHYYDAGDTFYIQFCASEKVVNHWFEKKDLVIVVPLEYSLENIDLSAVSANVEVKDLRLKTVEINSVSGEVLTSSISSDSLVIDNVSGKIILNSTDVDTFKANNVSGSVNANDSNLNNIDVKTVSGNVNLSVANEAENFKLNTVSGNISLGLVETLGFTVTISKVSGDFSCDYPTTVTNKQYVYSTGDCPINISTVSGNVKINKLN
ncbi:MAG: DUF4097 family beta strand repeat-containing protein [Bacilli bacterium]